MSNVDHDVLKIKLCSILQDCKLDPMTKRTVRRQLEKDLSLADGALDQEKKLISGLVDEYVSRHKMGTDERPNLEVNSRSNYRHRLMPLLAEFVGADRMKHADITKRLSDYVVKNKLQVIEFICFASYAHV